MISDAAYTRTECGESDQFRSPRDSVPIGEFPSPLCDPVASECRNSQPHSGPTTRCRVSSSCLRKCGNSRAVRVKSGCPSFLNSHIQCESGESWEQRFGRLLHESCKTVRACHDLCIHIHAKQSCLRRTSLQCLNPCLLIDADRVNAITYIVRDRLLIGIAYRCNTWIVKRIGFVFAGQPILVLVRPNVCTSQ